MPANRDDGDIPLPFDEEMSIREMKASFTSNKGALTHLIRTAKPHAEMFVAIKSSAYATALNEAYSKLLAKCNFLHHAAHQLILVVNQQIWQNTQAQLHPLQEQIEHIYGNAQVSVDMAAQLHETGGEAPGASRIRVRMDLKPRDLSSNTTPTEFCRWRR